MNPVSEIRIVNLPGADIQPDNFGVFDAELPARLPDDSVLLRNDWFGVNAGMRSRIGAAGVSTANQKERQQGNPAQLGPGGGQRTEGGGARAGCKETLLGSGEVCIAVDRAVWAALAIGGANRVHPPGVMKA